MDTITLQLAGAVLAHYVDMSAEHRYEGADLEKELEDIHYILRMVRVAEAELKDRERVLKINPGVSV